jgi:hypothetical protein
MPHTRRGSFGTTEPSQRVSAKNDLLFEFLIHLQPNQAQRKPTFVL